MIKLNMYFSRLTDKKYNKMNFVMFSGFPSSYNTLLRTI